MIPAVSVSGGGGTYADFVVIGSERALAGSDSAAYIYALPFSVGTGFGTAFSAPTPAFQNSRQPGAVGFNSTTTVAGGQWLRSTISGGTDSFPMKAWAFTASGWGSAYADPASASSNGTNQNNADYKFFGTSLFAVTTNQSPYVGVYTWSDSTGFGTKYGNPPTLPTGGGGAISYRSTATTAMAIAHATTPFVSAYPWSSGFGAKYANPATLPAGQGLGISYSPDGSNVLIGHATTPFISAYAWSSGWGTKYANPASLPANTGYEVAWRGQGGSDVIVAHGTSPWVAAYPWSSGFGTKYANPASLPSGSTWNAHWNYDGNTVLTTGGTAGTVNAWSWSSGWGTKYTDYTPTYQAKYAHFNN